MKRCHAQLLLQRLPSYVQCVADFKYHLASEAILPDYQRTRTSIELSDPWIAVAAPLLLFAACERLYMMMDHLEDKLGEMLSQVAKDLVKVSAALLNDEDHIHQDQTVPSDRGLSSRIGPAQRMTVAHEFQSSEGVGVMSALEFLRQLGLIVKVRFHQTRIFIEAVADCSKDTLDHPMIQPLAELLEQEMGVVRAACKAIDVHKATSSRHEAVVLSLLELRNAIVSWEGRQGQFDLCRRVKSILRSITWKITRGDRTLDLMDRGSGCAMQSQEQQTGGDSNRPRTRVSAGDPVKGRPKSPGENSAMAGEGHDRVRGPSYRCPPFLEYSGRTCSEVSPGEAAASEWPSSQEVVNNNIDGMEANTADFSYRIRIARGDRSV
eukprot:jgi/Undpi1/397/HiC_scaffold_1.g00393.m1